MSYVLSHWDAIPHAGGGQPGLLSGDVQARAGLPNLVADPLGFWHFLLFTLPWRIGSSLKRMVLWVCGTPIENHNHSFVNYAQVWPPHACGVSSLRSPVG